MTLYKREVKPMYYSPACQGFSDTYTPWVDKWFDESFEQRLREVCEPQIKEHDAWGSLKFEERFIAVDTSDDWKELDKVFEYESSN